MLVNHWQHDQGLFDTWEWRKRFWKMQVARYGQERMTAWLNSLPDKLKGRIDFLEKVSEA